jgi:coenzyme PQQ precursor peptide PqqA
LQGGEACIKSFDGWAGRISIRHLDRPIGRIFRNLMSGGTVAMSWKTPKVVEIALGAEINSYACAEVK